MMYRNVSCNQLSVISRYSVSLISHTHTHTHRYLQSIRDPDQDCDMVL